MPTTLAIFQEDHRRVLAAADSESTYPAPATGTSKEEEEEKDQKYYLVDVEAKKMWPAVNCGEGRPKQEGEGPSDVYVSLMVAGNAWVSWQRTHLIEPIRKLQLNVDPRLRVPQVVDLLENGLQQIRAIKEEGQPNVDIEMFAIIQTPGTELHTYCFRTGKRASKLGIGECQIIGGKNQPGMHDELRRVFYQAVPHEIREGGRWNDNKLEAYAKALTKVIGHSAMRHFATGGFSRVYFFTPFATVYAMRDFGLEETEKDAEVKEKMLHIVSQGEEHPLEKLQDLRLRTAEEEKFRPLTPPTPS